MTDSTISGNSSLDGGGIENMAYYGDQQHPLGQLGEHRRWRHPQQQSILRAHNHQQKTLRQFGEQRRWGIENGGGAVAVNSPLSGNSASPTRSGLPAVAGSTVASFPCWDKDCLNNTILASVFGRKLYFHRWDVTL